MLQQTSHHAMPYTHVPCLTLMGAVVAACDARANGFALTTALVPLSGCSVGDVDAVDVTALVTGDLPPAGGGPPASFGLAAIAAATHPDDTCMTHRPMTCPAHRACPAMHRCFSPDACADDLICATNVLASGLADVPVLARPL